MTAKEYLWQIRDMDARIRNSQKFYERLIRDAASLKSPRYDSDKVQTSATGAGFERVIDKIIDQQAKVNRLIDEMVDKRFLIISQINELKAPYSKILYLRYVDMKNFEQIADELAYTYQYTLELHGVALLMFSKMWLRGEAQ